LTIPKRKSNKGHIVLFSTKSITSTPSLSSYRIKDKHVEEVLRNDFVVIPNFIPTSLVKSLQKDIDFLRQDGADQFRIAKIGQDDTNTLNENIRVAETCFIGRSKLKEYPNSHRDELYQILDTIGLDLGKKTTIALDENLSEFLYVFYPKGGFYRRHRDAIPNSASTLRQYSFLLYLNEDWTPNEKGELRIHRDTGGDFLPSGEEPNYIDVPPKAGTLVLFKSDKIPHEVLNTNSKRYVVVGWYNRAVSASDIISLGDNNIRSLMLVASFTLVCIGLVSLLS